MTIGDYFTSCQFFWQIRDDQKHERGLHEVILSSCSELIIINYIKNLYKCLEINFDLY